MTVSELESHEHNVQHLKNILEQLLNINEDLKRDKNLLSYKCTPPEKIKIETTAKSKQLEVDEIKADATFEVRPEKMETETSVESKQLEVDEIKGDAKSYISEDKNIEDDISMIDESVFILPIIDEILKKLASGSSAQDVATSLVEEIILRTGN